MTIATVRGEPYHELPRDLFIPPDALEVFLETFEGPLDLLLYLIRRQNLDILDIPIARITDQYMHYVDLMTGKRLALASDYLVMAAMLAEIKSRMLMPRTPARDEEDDPDPRAELVRRLREYEQFRDAGERLDALPRMGRELAPARVAESMERVPGPAPRVGVDELRDAFAAVMERAALNRHHAIRREALSVRERMSETLALVDGDRFVVLTDLLDAREGRAGVVVTFLAVLELLKARLLELVQSEPLAPLYLRARQPHG
ncbi:segregation and condensation protein A [Spiribacter vilamensis]|uniref:Segregation and condensation protein A n=1 Tax=Spiribacter vilamensis TaxID=531306 RepID=A0A4Q8D0K9_9GAMM|nr:ScpA family protein [Spiribacter vilamensis]RZU98833.1 condensin subunit ScpA [Spiribacter vilamensis]TVO62148.1 segregation/condensation protein A [Spiribacter vilamensis]